MKAPETPRDLPSTINRLVASVETLTALLVHLGHVSGEKPVDSETALRVRALAETVVDLDGVDPVVVRAQGAMGRAMLAQSAAFSASPDEPSAWAITDPFVLQMLGRGSSAFASIVVGEIAPTIEAFASRLARDGLRVLDVGVGVAALSIAFANHLPTATVVGLDVWEPALALARSNIAAAGLEDRVEVRCEDVSVFADPEGFDLVWFAGPFIPGPLQPAGIAKCFESMRPGGWFVYGAFSGGDDPVVSALGDLRTLRSGGPVLTTGEIVAMVRAAGLVDVEETVVAVGIASRVVVGRRP